MANSKITDLTSAAAAVGDEIPINRAGADRKIQLGGNLPFSDGFGLSASSVQRVVVGSTATDYFDGWNDVVKMELGASSYPALLLQTTNAGVQGPAIVRFANSASAADGDILGENWYYGNNALGNTMFWGSDAMRIVSASTTPGRQAKWTIALIVANNYRFQFQVSDGLAVSTQASPTFPGEGSIRADKFVKTGVTSVAGLPAATTVNEGARYYVNDATTNAFMAPAVAGSTYRVPVVSNGTGWVIG